MGLHQRMMHSPTNDKIMCNRYNIILTSSTANNWHCADFGHLLFKIPTDWRVQWLSDKLVIL